MSVTYVVDTNVILVANQMHGEVSPDCIAQSALKLQDIMKKGRIALDDSWLIIKEYQEKLDSKRAPRPGDEFVKWVLRNMGARDRCDLVNLQENAARGFESFPDDAELNDFDISDRKFVSVSAAHENHPEILQACDSKWLKYEPCLKKHKIIVQFICLEDIKKFQANKTKGQ